MDDVEGWGVGGKTTKGGRRKKKIKSSPLLMDSTNSLSVLGGRCEWCVGYSAT